MWGQWEALQKQINKAVKDTGLDQQLNDVRKRATESINKIASQVVTVEKEEQANDQHTYPDGGPVQNLEQPDPDEGQVGQVPQLSISQTLQVRQVDSDREGEGWEGDTDLEDIDLSDNLTPRNDIPQDSAFNSKEQLVNKKDTHQQPQNVSHQSQIQKLQQENFQLKKRLVVVEEAASDALGESEELREQLQSARSNLDKVQSDKQDLYQESQQLDEVVRSLKAQVQQFENDQIRQAEQEGHYLSSLNKLHRQARELFERYQDFGQNTQQLKELQRSLQNLDGLTQHPSFLSPSPPAPPPPQQKDSIPQKEIQSMLSEFETTLTSLRTLQISVNQIENNLHESQISNLKIDKGTAQNEEIEVVRRELVQQTEKLEKEKQNEIKIIKQQQKEAVQKLEKEMRILENSLVNQRKEVEEKLGSQIGRLTDQVSDLQAVIENKDRYIKECQESLRKKGEELETLREGAKAESNLAAANIRDACKRAEDAEKQAKNLQSQNVALQSAQNTSQELSQQLQQLQSDVDSKSKRIQSLEAQIKSFTDTLASERDMAQMEIQEMQKQFQGKLEEAERKGREEGRSEVLNQIASDTEQQQQSQQAIQKAKDEEIENLKVQITKLQKVEEEHLQLTQAQNTLAESHSTLQAQFQQSQQSNQTQIERISTLDAKLLSLQNQIQERSKRFIMLQKGFDVKQQGLFDENSRLQTQIQEKEQAQTQMAQELEQLKIQLKESQDGLQEALQRVERKSESLQQLNVQLYELRGSLGDKDGRIFELETELKGAIDRSENVGMSSSQKEDIQHIIDEAVEVQVVKVQQEVQQIRSELELQKKRAESAERDRDTAENAKIELAMQLARLDQSKDLETTVSSRTLGQDELLNRAEEAEMALSVYRTRATKAEEELGEKTMKLSALEQQVEQLSWQIKMVTSGNSNATYNSESGSSAAGWLDVLGCGANFKRNQK
eukprot:TRINITY_DN4200_c0_g1_i5.p1 TRINITY_DN4200_c0_g1~~TRINITY_DN4200_c0_g1_i5.p1  ORF type:complete len:953 (+),score=184.20 TRINITY_DN4200_c0_g1_i5:156-3014(+)